MRRISGILLCICLALVLVMGTATGTFAAGSISDNPTGDVEVVPGSDVDTAPSEEDSKYNGSPSDISEEFGYDPEEMETTDGLPINLELYDRITDFVDLGEMKDGKISYELNGEKQITVRSDALKGLDKSDILVMIINPDTGEIYLIVPDEFDSENGILTFTTPSYGKLCIVQKIPIVVRDIHPEEYPNLQVAEAVSKVDEDDYVELSEWLEAFGIDDDELEVAEGTVVDVDDYSSANYVADIAVELNRDTFNYKLSTKIWANLYQDINEVDWARVLDYAGVDYDVDEINEDPLKLTEIEPFTLEDSFIYHVDADTAEVSIAYEPEIKFEIEEEQNESLNKKVENGQKNIDGSDMDIQIDDPDDADNVEEDEDSDAGDDTSVMDYIIPSVYAESQDNYTEEQKKILTFDVNDIDEKNIENLCIVMTSDKYLGMGPFMLFMPKEKTSMWWLWLILILLLLIIIIFIIIRRTRRTKRAAASAFAGAAAEATEE